MPRRSAKKNEEVMLPAITPEGPSILPMKADNIVSDEVLAELGVDKSSLSDFWIALQFVILQTQRKSISEIAEILKIDRPSFYDPKWRDLINSARRLVISKAMLEVDGIVAFVYENWPAMVQSTVNVALYGKRDADKVEAFKAIHEIFIANAEKTPDTSDARKYLGEKPNFNPASSFIQAQAGAVVNITVQKGGESASPEPPVIDVQALDFSPKALE
jgi:hypothetical protein